MKNINEALRSWVKTSAPRFLTWEQRQAFLAKKEVAEGLTRNFRGMSPPLGA